MKRVLESIEARRVAAIEGQGEPPAPTFGVEARVGEEGPDWDLVQTDGSVTIVEEVKSGIIKAQDRNALWQRLRRTLATLPAGAAARGIVLRLTTNKENPISDHWLGLRSNATTASAEWPADDATRKPVGDAVDLASEALAALMRTDTGGVPSAVSEEVARQVLASLEIREFSRSELEESVEKALARLSSGLAVQVLCHALRGAIATRAEDLDGSQHRFTVDELLVELSVLQHVAAVDFESAKTWRDLEERSTERLRSAFSLPSGGLAYVDWTDLHPGIAVALANEQRTVIYGRGGLGKSVILDTWVRGRSQAGDVAILLAGVDLAHLSAQRLSEAFRLGVSLAEARGVAFAVAIDAIENCGDDERIRVLLSCLPRLAATSVVTCRASQWLAAQASHEVLPGWHAVALEDWPEDLVRKEVNAGARTGIGSDLLRLLRTPLILDLFLRTFDREMTVPSGIQTRHAVLSAYWSRRVLPPNDPRSAERAKTLDRVAREETEGTQHHTLVGSAWEELLSEGLFSVVMGRAHFRHALLRDFAM